MAGDWIKVETCTPDKPEVYQISEILGVDPDSVIGKLIRIWVWADQQTIDGNACGVTKALLDRVTGVSGFTEAMLQVGWLSKTDGGFQLPNFERHNGQTAKKRSQTAKRVQKHRDPESKQRNADCNAASVTKTLPEKRREEKNPSSDEEGGKAAVAAAPDWQEQILEAFDETFGTTSRLTQARVRHLNARWKDPWWRENWQQALDRGGQSAFLRGANDRGWVIDFEFFLRADTATKIIEGKYDDRQQHAGKITPNQQRENNTAAVFDRFRQAAAEATAAGLIGGGAVSGRIDAAG